MLSKLILILYVLSASFGLVTLKLGTKAGLPVNLANDKLNFNINPFTVAGFGLYGLSFLLYLYLISKNDLGYIIPLTTGLVYVIIFVASYFIFKESFTPAKLAAIGMILAGVIVLNLQK